MAAICYPIQTGSVLNVADVSTLHSPQGTEKVLPRSCDDFDFSAVSPGAKHDDWDAASLASSAETASLADMASPELAREPSPSYADILRSSQRPIETHDAVMPSHAVLQSSRWTGGNDSNDAARALSRSPEPPSLVAPATRRSFYSDVVLSWRSAPMWDRVDLLPRIHLPGSAGCTSSAMDAFAYLEAACASPAAVDAALAAHMSKTQRQYAELKLSRKLPASVTDVLETKVLRDNLCTFCLSLQNIELAADGRVLRAFCKCCCAKLGHLELNRCKGRSLQCKNYRWVDGLGNTAAVCSACHRTNVHSSFRSMAANPASVARPSQASDRKSGGR